MLTFSVVLFMTVSCEKPDDKSSGPDTDLNNDEEKPPAIYDDIVLNEINLIMGEHEWHIHDFDVTYEKTKLYFNIHTKKNFDATLYFILVNFAVDSFPFGIGTSNIVNLRFPSFNEDEYLVDEYETSYNGDFPSGYFVIDFIDTTELIVYGYFEFMNPDDPTYPDYRKIQKSYFKVNYELGTNSLYDNSADIFMNSGALNVIDIYSKYHYSHIHNWIVFDNNSAVQTYFFEGNLELGHNLVTSSGFNAVWLKNVDFPFHFYGWTDDVVYRADSGYVNIMLLDLDNHIIEGDLNLFFKNDNLTGSFVIYY